MTSSSSRKRWEVGDGDRGCASSSRSRGGFVELFVVAERSANRGGCNGREPAPVRGLRGNRRRRCAWLSIGREEVGAVDFEREQAREIGQQFGDGAAGRLILDRDGDGVSVVLNQEDNRGVAEAGVVDGFPEFAFAGGAFAGTGDDDAVFAGVEEAEAFGAADGLHELRAGGGGTGDDVEGRVAPVGRHLASAGTGVFSGSHGLQQHGTRASCRG